MVLVLNDKHVWAILDALAVQRLKGNAEADEAARAILDEELKEKAEHYVDSHDTELEGMEEILDASRLVKAAYIAGAKENMRDAV